MKKIIIHIYLLAIALIAVQAHCSPLNALKDAKKQLELGRQSIIDGKKGVIDGYTYIKWNVVDAMNSAADGVQNQMNDLDNKKGIASDMLDKKLPELLGLVTGVSFIFPAAAPLILAIPTMELVLWDVPKTMGAINNTLDTIVQALHRVVAAINPANEKLNPHSVAVWIDRDTIAIADAKSALAKADFVQPSLAQFIANVTNELSQILDDAKKNINATTNKIKNSKVTNALLDRLKLQQNAIDATQKDLNDIEKNAKKDPAKKADRAKYYKLSASEDDNSSYINNINSMLDGLTHAIKPLVAQLNEDLGTGTKNIPPVYQKFDDAQAKFDKAIGKIDEIIEGFEEALSEV